MMSAPSAKKLSMAPAENKIRNDNKTHLFQPLFFCVPMPNFQASFKNMRPANNLDDMIKVNIYRSLPALPERILFFTVPYERRAGVFRWAAFGGFVCRHFQPV